MCEIERTLKRGATTPHIAYRKEEVEGHKLEIQEILSVLTATAAESRTLLTLPSPILCGILTVPRFTPLSWFQHSSVQTLDRARVRPA